MSTTNTLPTARLDIGLAILRLALGVVFVAHGAQKIFVYGLDGVAEGFAGLGIPFAGLAAPVVAFAELIGGAALVIGLFTRVSAAVLALTMAGALVLAHLPAGFFLPNGYEFVFALMGGAVALALIGAGSYSADTALARRRDAGPGARRLS